MYEYICICIYIYIRMNENTHIYTYIWVTCVWSIHYQYLPGLIQFLTGHDILISWHICVRVCVFICVLISIIFFCLLFMFWIEPSKNGVMALLPNTRVVYVFLYIFIFMRVYIRMHVERALGFRICIYWFQKVALCGTLTLEWVCVSVHACIHAEIVYAYTCIHICIYA